MFLSCKKDFMKWTMSQPSYKKKLQIQIVMFEITLAFEVVIFRWSLKCSAFLLGGSSHYPPHSFGCCFRVCMSFQVDWFP